MCALLGTPEIVALLPTGEQPTYQNLAASMEWWWNNTVIPLEDAFADGIATQLFPAFGLDRHEYRLTWDRSQVPALQEDEISKHQMVREDYRAGVIDLFTATVQLGGEAVEEMRGVYHPSAVPHINPTNYHPNPFPFHGAQSLRLHKLRRKFSQLATKRGLLVSMSGCLPVCCLLSPTYPQREKVIL